GGGWRRIGGPGAVPEAVDQVGAGLPELVGSPAVELQVVQILLGPHGVVPERVVGGGGGQIDPDRAAEPGDQDRHRGESKAPGRDAAFQLSALGHGPSESKQQPAGRVGAALCRTYYSRTV